MIIAIGTPAVALTGMGISGCPIRANSKFCAKEFATNKLLTIYVPNKTI